jgi:hypothetical protein
MIRMKLAVAMAAALFAVGVPAAWADRPDALPEQASDTATQPVEQAEDPQTPEGAEKAEDAERPEQAGEKKTAIARTPCEERDFARVFKPWHDRRLYTLAPGGDFETLAEDWTLEGGAVLAADSSPFLLGAALGASSLELPAGASALSPPICVERGFPNFRFLARSVNADDQAVVKVQVIYADGRRKATGRVKPAADWAPTRKLSLAQGRFRIRRGRSAEVQLRFAVTAGTARVDDVYVDPRIRR